MSYTLKDAEKQWSNPYFGLSNKSISGLVSDDDSSNINASIKPIDREDSNLEAEKNELVFQPTGELYTIKGKTHGKGGTPLNLPKGAFIFSNYKPLAISKEDKKQFEFKEGGSTKIVLNTPAKLLSREIDIKHHNKMLAILKSDKHDEISKTSARLMLEKNLPKIGQVAFLQEEKKGFPDGVPDFSQGTAPAEQNLDYMKKQFKMGGTNNPYLEKYQQGSIVDGKAVGMPFTPTIHERDFNYKQKKELNPYLGDNTWKGNASKYSQDEIISKLQGIGFDGPRNVLSAQHWLNTNPNYNELVKKYHTPEPNGFGPTLSGEVEDNNWGHRWDNILDDAVKWNGEIPPSDTPYKNTLPYNPPVGIKSNTPNEPKVPVGQYYNEVPRSGLQNLVLGNDYSNALNVQRLNPMRSQESFVPLTQERINNQPYLNNINNQISSTRSLSQVMNPYQAAALQSKTVGQGLDKSSEVLGNINNQNLQISNNENQFNNRGVNDAANKNVIYNQSYYDQTQKAEGNYQNTKDILRNNVVKTYANQSQDNEKLRFNLDSLKSEGSVYINPKNNLPIKDTDLQDKAKEEGITPEAYVSKYGLKKQSMAPMFFNPYTRRIEHSGINFDPRTMSTQSGMSAAQFFKDTEGKTSAQIQGYSRFLAGQKNQNPYN